MSLRQTILGLCVSAVALAGTVTTVSAAGSDVGPGARSSAISSVHVAATPAVAPAIGGGALRLAAAPARGFGEAPTAADEEALPASSLGVMAVAALMLVGLLMTRRSGRG